MYGNEVAVPMATIAIPDLDHLTTTDENGEYQFEELPAVKYTINCHFYVYEAPAPVELTIASSERQQVGFALTPLIVPELT